MLSVVVGRVHDRAGRALFVARVFKQRPRRSRVGVTAGLCWPCSCSRSVAFVLDGVLIGAGDVRFLGRAMVIAVAIYVPFVALPLRYPSLGIVGVWAALAVWMTARAALMHRRFRGTAWIS